METLLWGFDLLAVVYLCFWAVAQDTVKPGAMGEDK